MTSKELIQEGYIWKNTSRFWSRRCPQCADTIDHIGVSDRRMKDVCRRAHINQCVCVTCRGANQNGVELKPPPVGVWKDSSSRWCRICPKCTKTVVHKGEIELCVKHKCTFAHNQQRPCKICSITKAKELPEGVWHENQCWCRKCPRCDKVIKYPHDEWAKYTCIKGVFGKKTCKSCRAEVSSERQTGQKRSAEWCKSIGDSKRGPKNPWYGKTRPPELVHKTMLALEKSRYKRKEYIFPCGQRVLVQGYEPQTIDYLLGEGVKDIAVKAADMPKIMYEWQGKTKRYYADCFVDKVKVVETKSTYTWLFEEERNKTKLRAAVMQGHDVMLFVWKNKKELLLKMVISKNVEPVFPTKEHLGAA